MSLFCTHGMPSPASCVDCMDDEGLGAPAIHPERADGPPVPARYSERCPLCDETIYPTQLVVHTTHDRWVHRECVR